MLLDTHKSEIDAIVARYPSKRSAVLPLLYVAQDSYGYLTRDAIREVAELLDLPVTDVHEVVGFYTLFYNQPVGTWMLQVCDDVPCCYLGAEDLISALKQTLGIQEEQTTPDGMFTLQRVKCIAACNRAPVLQANLDYVYDVTADKVDALLNDLRSRAEEAKKRGRSGRFAEDYEIDAAKRSVHLQRSVSQPAVSIKPISDEAQKFDQVEAEAPAAAAAAEAKIENESPTIAAPDGAPAGEMPRPGADQGAVPAQAAQREAPSESSVSSEKSETEKKSE